MRYFCLHFISVLLSRYVCSYTLFFSKDVFFPAQAEYSYFSADFRLKMFLCYSYIISYGIFVLFRIYWAINDKCLISWSGSVLCACALDTTFRSEVKMSRQNIFFIYKKCISRHFFFSIRQEQQSGLMYYLKNDCECFIGVSNTRKLMKARVFEITSPTKKISLNYRLNKVSQFNYYIWDVKCSWCA